MMNKWNSYLLAGFFGLGLAACSEDDNQPGELNTAFEMVANKGEFATSQLDTLLLSAGDAGYYTDYRWMVDGKEVGTSAQYAFVANKRGAYKVKCTACGKGGELVSAEQAIEVTGRFGKGTFILNEGNMTDETGTLTFIGEDGVAIDSAYYRVNGTLLGNVAQDLFISQGKLYVISQNGTKNNGGGTLIVADAESLEKEKVYNEEVTSDLEWPTHIAVQGDYIYIRDNKGVYLLKQSTGELSFIEKTEKADKRRMAAVGGKVFVSRKKQVLVFENGKMVKEIDVKNTISGLVPSYDGKLWVSCDTKPGQILKMDPENGTVIESQNIQNGGLKADWGAAPVFSAVKDTLYFCNSGMTLYRHVFTAKKTETVVDSFTDYLPDAGMYYNSLGVNPKTGVVCFATLKGYGMAYKKNDIGLFDFRKDNPMIADFKSMNSFPAGVFYTYNFQ